MSQSRDDGGQCHPDVTDERILAVFENETDPVLTTREVAAGLERFGFQPSPERVRPCLNQMHAKGLVTRIEFGSRAVGWWADVAAEANADTTGPANETTESGE